MGETQKMPLETAWKNWEACLKGGETNSIFQQIRLMIWDTGIFQIILAARQSQLKKNPQGPEINEALHSFIDRNYFQAQSIIIRRITDERYDLTGNKGVYSLTALIKDIKNFNNELTRKSYLELKNMPYDYKEIRRREEEYIRSQPLGKGFFVPPELDWQSIEEAHCMFDRLANVSPENRNPTDLIANHAFVKLFEKLSVCSDITKYVDKFLAHSSTPESRALQNYTSTAITFKSLWNAHQTIFDIANFLSVVLFSEIHMALPLENPTFFEFWEKPFFENGELDLVITSFENYRKETEAWQSDSVENVWRAIEVT